MDILDYSAVDLGTMLRTKEISCIDVLNVVYDRYEKGNQRLNAYTDFDYSIAYHEAEKAQNLIMKGESPSILTGVPIAVKDNICTQGILTTCASKILSGFKPPFDATVIKLVKSAGLVVAGKLNMDEFAMGSTSETSFYGEVHNPWNIDCVPGGSSGGAAAAVAGHLAVCALGSDTGGSIRQPASYCGVTGFKPSYGTVSRYGLVAYASSLDQIGPIASDTRDCAAIMDIIAADDSLDSTCRYSKLDEYLTSLNKDIKGLRIGVPEECFSDGVDNSVRLAVEEMISVLKSVGGSVTHINLPFIRYAVPTYYIIATAEASSNLSRFDGVKYGYRTSGAETVDDLFIKSRSEGFGDEVKKRIMLGTFVLSSGYYDAYYNKALKMKQMIVDGFEKAFAECDIIVCPTSPVTAPKLGNSLNDSIKMYLSDIFTVSVNLAGLPALSVPCGFDNDKMPIGAQIIGPWGYDSKVLSAGYAYQSFTDFHKRKPEVNS